MPELPEVESTARGVAPHVQDRIITRLAVHEPRLRWRVNPGLAAWAEGQRIRTVGRRAKYLLLQVERGYLMIHLGMSGSLRVLPMRTALEPHDHFDVELDSGWLLRFNDPRRFGSLHHLTGDPAGHPLLRDLAPEPLEDAFDGEYLHRVLRRRRVAVKQAIMNGHLVTGVGNIYASEALFRAGISPGRAAGSLKRAESEALAVAIRTVLQESIEAGGTTIRDYVGAGGDEGGFGERLFVYDRAGQPCRRCGTLVKQRVQGGRATFWCPKCQR